MCTFLGDDYFDYTYPKGTWVDVISNPVPVN